MPKSGSLLCREFDVVDIFYKTSVGCYFTYFPTFIVPYYLTTEKIKVLANYKLVI